MTNSLIIGGSKGIGYSISKALIKRGDNLFIISRKKIKLKNSYSLNLLDEISVKKFFKNFSKNKIKIDNLIFSQRYRGDKYEEENQLIIKSTQLIIKILFKNFKKNTSIVFIGSPASKYIAKQVNLSYHLTRASLNILMKYYAVNLGKYGIRSNSVMTGTVIKKENKKYFQENPKIISELIKKTPLKNIGKSDDIANLVMFLCSNKSSFISGQSITVDGGLSAIMHESLL
tara:strand:- start:25193 stop:25882 length:690 start_codon:yes stop_codon:yes gene_type:complete